MGDKLKLTQTRLRAGVWEGVLAGVGETAPQLEVTHQGKPLPGLTVTALPKGPGDFLLRLPVPAELLNDGVQTFLLQSGGDTLAHFTIITGATSEEDLRVEIDLLRAELDLLKRAFRRHCAETAPAPSGE
ncbi:hypothetical protein [Fuscovulum blasticum]|uniref:hypothetical protein n=1 Tax=Fuscovulum blasticum TaxID=1075 RepID=UPI000D3E6A27|nr:hypothetical protein [Fuscovulum blasticum]AWD21737.1 hypothetical protein B6K69_08645 [Fuscovulum blasticum]